MQSLPLGAFVEMANDYDHKLGAVWYENGNSVVRIKPGSLEAQRYERLFHGVQFLETEIKLNS